MKGYNIKELLAMQNKETKITDDIRYKVYYLRKGIGFEEPDDWLLKEQDFYFYNLAPAGLKYLSEEWCEYHHYQIDKRKNNNIEVLKDVEFEGFADEGWFKVNIYAKEEIPKLEEHYVGKKWYSKENTYKYKFDNETKILHSQKHQVLKEKIIRYLKGEHNINISENLKGVLKGENRPLTQDEISAMAELLAEEKNIINMLEINKEIYNQIIE